MSECVLKPAGKLQLLPEICHSQSQLMTSNKFDEISYCNSKYLDFTLKCSTFKNPEIKGVAAAALTKYKHIIIEDLINILVT